MSSFIYKILFDKQKPLYYNSITVLLLKDAPPIIQSCSITSSIDDPLALDDIRFSFIKNIKVSF